MKGRGLLAQAGVRQGGDAEKDYARPFASERAIPSVHGELLVYHHHHGTSNTEMIHSSLLHNVSQGLLELRMSVVGC